MTTPMRATPTGATAASSPGGMLTRTPTSAGGASPFSPGSPGSPPGETIPLNCTVTGDGLRQAMARQKANFQIEAYDANKNKQESGGERFKVSIRGSSTVNAKVTDKENGSYVVEYKASTSGSYSISITLNGVSLPGSPFKLEVLTPAPDPTKCVLRGDALTNAKAREIATFEVEFIDALEAIARAEELDVWVEKIAAGDAPLITRHPSDQGGGADGGRVEVGAKPLIVRKHSALESDIVAMLRPGQLVTVLEELELGDGKLRAKVEQVEGEAAARAIAESWWSPPAKPNGMEPLVDTPLSARMHLLTSSRGSSPSMVGSVVAGSASYFNDVETRPWWIPPPSPGRNDGGGGGGGTLAHHYASDPHGGGASSPPPMLVDDYLNSYIDSARGQGPPSTFGKNKKGAPVRGWVTLLKEGAELVAPRPRLNAGERRKHMELWMRREVADKNLKKSIEAASLKGSTEKELKKNNPETAIGPSMAHECNDDDEGVAFAYGGLHPGTLHASGKLVRAHSVRYSIGRSGHYKLHVGLRAQAIPLPGSPFSLYVAPSNAHAISTSLVDSLPLTGVVGEDWSCTCTLHVVDRMGNRCVTGGASIAVDVDNNDKFYSQIIDNSDGSYTLQWRGITAGEFRTQVRIDNVHVHGSPTTIRMSSGPPDVPKCEINGAGLKTALAGQPTCVYVTCKDRYSNPLSSASLAEGNALSFGLALLPVGDNKALKDTIPSMEFDGNWVKSGDDDGKTGAESFEIQYMAKEAGSFELHVWCNPDGAVGAGSSAETRQWLTGSPFSVLVTGVRPSKEGSTVERFGEELLMAGETIVLRPQLRDQFGNASEALEGCFVATIDVPDGVHELELKSLKGLGNYEVAYDVVTKGKHAVHFLLNGDEITGSPVSYTVSPASAVGSKSRLYPPAKEPIINQPCVLLLEAVDKYGNKLDTGGSRVDARANGPGVSACVAEDQNDGTYTITFSAAVVGETRVTVRLDNVEMAPMKIQFNDGGKGGGKGGGGGKGASADMPQEAGQEAPEEAAQPRKGSMQGGEQTMAAPAKKAAPAAAERGPPPSEDASSAPPSQRI